MELLQNFKQLCAYQIQRRIKNPFSYAISLLFAISFLCVYHSIFEKYWPILLQSYKFNTSSLYLILAFGVSWTVQILACSVYSFIDYFNLFPECKITKTNLIWEVDPPAWKKLRMKSIKLNLINVVFINSIGVILQSRSISSSIFRVQVPSIYEMAAQLAFCVFAQSAFFHLFHKIGHLYLYNIHKVHHEYIVPCLWTGSHTHPIDYLIGGAAPFFIATKLLFGKFHMTTYMLFAIFRILQGYDAHSNYEFPWSPFRLFPFSTSSQYHSFHHTHNIGNYGSASAVSDSAFGDNKEFFKYKAKKDKEDLKRIKKVQ